MARAPNYYKYSPIRVILGHSGRSARPQRLLREGLAQQNCARRDFGSVKLEAFRRGFSWSISHKSEGNDWAATSSKKVQRHRDAAFCLQLTASCLQWSVFTYSCVWECFLLTVGAVLHTASAFLLRIATFLLTVGTVVE